MIADVIFSTNFLFEYLWPKTSIGLSNQISNEIFRHCSSNLNVILYALVKEVYFNPFKFLS